MKYIIVYMLMSIVVYATDFPEQSQILLDSSLKHLRMNRADLAMPWDAVKIDRHRTPLQKNLFNNPLIMGRVISTHSEGLQKALKGNTEPWFSAIMDHGGIGNYTQHYLRDDITAKEFDVLIGKQLDNQVNLTTAFVIRQYVGPLLQAIKNISKQRSGLLHDSLIMHQADSMLMLSEDAQNASVYSLKRSEILGSEQAKTFFARANPPDEIVEYGMSLAALYPALYEISKTLTSEYAKDLQSITIDTPYGRIAIGSHGNDIYSGDYLLILDPAGDDIYKNQSGKQGALLYPIRCIIDFAGNDMYNAESYAIGSGLFGIGLHFDFSGNDIYRSEDFSIGCGVFGFGYVYDADGSDVYSSSTNAQGMGSFGAGLLIDQSGNDMYTIQAHGQAFAATKGVGILADNNGNDVYACSSPFQDFLRYDSHFESFAQGAALGYRPIASGGLALLMDLQGNDSYIADIYGQGTGYWFGFGGLIDFDGEDHYQAYQYAQGSGVHLAQGLLWDKQGNDHYSSHGVSQGCGHDIAVGMLLDESGNDVYSVESLSLGAGNANAISLCMDIQGDDSYSAINTSNTMGYSDFRRNYGMIGIFADGAGKDVYSSPINNNRITLQSTYGIFLDKEFSWPKDSVKSSDIEEISNPTDSEIHGIVFSSMDSLFIRASAAPQKFQKDVEPARMAIIEKGLEALSYLAEKLGTESARERLALEALWPKLYTLYPEETKQILVEALESDSSEFISMAATLCGKMKLQAAIPSLVSLLDHQNWRLRTLASQQLGEIGNLAPENIQALSYRLQDEQPLVRARAGYSLGTLMPDDIMNLVRSTLFEELQIVRNSTLQGLLRSNKITLLWLKDKLTGKEPSLIKDHLAGLIIGVDTLSKPEQVIDLIMNNTIERKKIMYTSIASAKNLHKVSMWQSIIKGILKLEKDPQLLEIMVNTGVQESKYQTIKKKQ